MDHKIPKIHTLPMWKEYYGTLAEWDIGTSSRHDLIHIAVPAHKAEAIRLFLQELPTLWVHPISIPEEVCQWSREGRQWDMISVSG